MTALWTETTPRMIHGVSRRSRRPPPSVRSHSKGLSNLLSGQRKSPRLSSGMAKY